MIVVQCIMIGSDLVKFKVYATNVVVPLKRRADDSEETVRTRLAAIMSEHPSGDMV